MTRTKCLSGVLVALMAGFIFLGADEGGCGGSSVPADELCTLSGGTWVTECPPAAMPPACGTDLSTYVVATVCGTQPACRCPATAPYWINGQGCSDCSCPKANLPSKFRLDETTGSAILGSGATTLEIKNGDTKIGRIERKWLSLTRTFEYVNAAGALVATAKQELFSWGVRINVFDCHGAKLGTIDEEILKSLFKTWTTYSILDAQGKKIGFSEKSEWITTDFRLKDMAGNLVAEMHRPWINILGDNWDVTLHDSVTIDPRLYIMIGAYKTTVDKERREEEARQQQEQNADN